MSASMSHAASAEPDLTPMLDMVFQLVTFFMLVINFKGASMDLSLKLPVLGSARPLDTDGQEELIVLNIDSAGILKVYGVPKPDVLAYMKGEARISIQKAKLTNPSFDITKDKDKLPELVVVRADRKTPFTKLNGIIKACQEAGYRRFALKAMNRAEDGGGR